MILIDHSEEEYAVQLFSTLPGKAVSLKHIALTYTIQLVTPSITIKNHQRQMPKRSEIWNHFNSIDSVKAKCRYCHEIVSFTSGSTSNLFRHMKRKHPISFNKRKNTEQSTEEIPVKKSHLTSIDTQNLSSLPSTSLASIHSEVADVAPLSSSAHKAPVIQKSLTDFVEVIKPLHPSKSKEIDEQLLKMIVKEYHPFSIVEDQEFRKLIKLLCPSYNVPSRKYISNSLLPMIYKREESKLKSRFNEVNAVCLTTDCWTSVNNESFIAITAHYIDQNTNLQTHLLKCTSYSERHTANNLASHLQSTVQEWELTNKVTAVVTDNGANIVSAVKQCNWRHISCFAHSMNLVVHSGIAEIRVTTDKIKALVEYFKRSSHSLTKLHNTQTQMGFPKLKLKQDVPTRWNSTFIMFDRVLKTKQPLIATIALLNLQGEHNITTIDWEILESAVQLLQIFNEITDEHRIGTATGIDERVFGIDSDPGVDSNPMIPQADSYSPSLLSKAARLPAGCITD
ncbi:E3 SUMO-protein ligase ZBED1-like [Rhodnius prolixus]|uniref:E3 SUMO-protein ligase ZBED1-like n=1 Tax=Rhodnius prolixus TaxID=13249 RepID=UPI003D1896FE